MRWAANFAGESDVQVSYIQRVIFDESATGLNDVTHQDREHFVSRPGVVLVEIHPEQLASRRIHRGGEELFGIHFAQTFEPLDLNTSPTDFLNHFEDAGDREDRR